MNKLHLLIICLVFVSCKKENKQDINWNVKYEVVSSQQGDVVYVQWSNGVNTYKTGSSLYQTWPACPWTKDTVFKYADGDRIISLNVISSVHPRSNVVGSITSRIYINGKVVKEAIGYNQFLQTGLR